MRILLAVSTFRDWEIEQLDVKTAYLEGDLSETIFMRSPEGLETTKYVQLNKPLYGLKQSGKAWYEKLESKLICLGFKKSLSDECIYIHTEKQVIIGVYVDDLVICSSHLRNISAIKKELAVYFPIKDLGPIGTIIGWKISRDRVNRKLKISQCPYIYDKLVTVLK